MFDPSVPLPAGLELSAIRRSIEYIERALNDEVLIDLYHEQANVCRLRHSMPLMAPWFGGQSPACPRAALRAMESAPT